MLVCDTVSMKRHRLVAKGNGTMSIRESQNDYHVPQWQGETDNEAAHRLAISEALILIMTLTESRSLSATGDVPLQELSAILNDWSQSIGVNIG